MIMENNLDLLIEADKTIKDRIKGALKSLAKWFRDKIDWAKRKFSTLKAKFTKSKPTPEKKKGFAKVKAGINGVITSCKQGLSACKSGAADRAAHCKDTVMSHMKQIKIGATVLGVAAGTAATAAAFYPRKKDRRVADDTKDPRKKDRRVADDTKDRDIDYSQWDIPGGPIINLNNMSKEERDEYWKNLGV